MRSVIAGERATRRQPADRVERPRSFLFFESDPKPYGLRSRRSPNLHNFFTPSTLTDPILLLQSKLQFVTKGPSDMTRSLKSLAWAVVISALGCGSQEPFGSNESEKIALDLAALADAAESEATFASFFSPEAVPQNRIDYAIRSYEIIDQVDISGDIATVKVTVNAGSMGAANSEGRQRTNKQPLPVISSEPTVVEWKLQKMGEQWKLVEAPLQ